ncbi:hypothetical protein [Paraferrimonas haliotis]|uniref:Uncharacterized protein n=1 Tax=Paraferrimonas haliotis TaxID=2013866 RepID=A0AA37WXV5_9GAMM|nr:hypothetical protein [Paraferrimonas haliotis]GLS82221.1 hypothetical protein GCM10007894_01980 [Paraferrimonas haliotis]
MESSNIGRNSQAFEVTLGFNISGLLAEMQSAAFMVWHAAIYSNFIDSDIERLVRRKLSDGSLQQLVIISAQPKCHWQQEFAAILRPSHSAIEVARLQQESRRWVDDLAKEFAANVEHQLTAAMPLQPLLLIQDSIYAGHYAHSHSTSAQGVWLKIDTVALGLNAGQIQHWFNNGIPNQTLSPTETALARYVSECSQGLSRL